MGKFSRYFGKEMGDAGENTGTGDKLPPIRHCTRNSENTKRQNHSMSVSLWRRSSAQDFLRDADSLVLIASSVSDWR
jgi:hypothetical protein